MRTSPTGCSSTSGVLPISSSSDGATTLRISLPEVDRRAELAEQLVDAPDGIGRVGRDHGLAVTTGQLVEAATEARESQQALPRVPGAFLDHLLAPLAAELRAGDERQAGGGGVPFGRSRLRARRV